MIRRYSRHMLVLAFMIRKPGSIGTITRAINILYRQVIQKFLPVMQR